MVLKGCRLLDRTDQQDRSNRKLLRYRIRKSPLDKTERMLSHPARSSRLVMVNRFLSLQLSVCRLDNSSILICQAIGTCLSDISGKMASRTENSGRLDNHSNLIRLFQKASIFQLGTRRISCCRLPHKCLPDMICNLLSQHSARSPTDTVCRWWN